MESSASERRGRLEDAWDNSGGLDAPTSLRAYLRTQERNARALTQSGSVLSSKGNGHETVFADYGPGAITPLGVAELFRWLVDEFDRVSVFLNQCALYGFDPFQVEFGSQPLNSGAVPVAEDLQVVLDLTGRIAIECERFGINSALVIGEAVGDKAVFIFMMYHLVAVTEEMSDFSGLRTTWGQFQ